MQIKIACVLVGILYCSGVRPCEESASDIMMQEKRMSGVDVLTERLIKIERHDFIKRTKFLQTVGDTVTRPRWVIRDFDVAFAEYVKSIVPTDVDEFGKNQVLNVGIWQVRSQMLKVFLQDFPGAVEQNEVEEKRRRASMESQPAAALHAPEHDNPDGSCKKALSGWCAIL